jgi:hypothetical protein
MADDKKRIINNVVFKNWPDKCINFCKTSKEMHPKSKFLNAVERQDADDCSPQR